MFDHPDFDDHKAVHIVSDAKSGLRAIIAVHNTSRGPGGGGTRFWSYPDPADALTDALRLSRAMSYKNVMADLDLGGGKGVILKPSGTFDRTALFEAYGRAIEQIRGQYITAEDVGVSPTDMAVIKTQTDYVAGLNTGQAASGDPSPVTAEGVFRGLKVALKHRLGADSFSRISVAVQGLGHVGYALAEHLFKAGAKLYVADINPSVLDKAQRELGAEIVSIDDVHRLDVDIFAPCALGGAVNAETVHEIKAKIVGGAANNQLAVRKMGDILRDRGILYCPDYVLNAGGIINVASEVSGTYSKDWVDGKLDVLEQTLSDIFIRADQENRSTSAVADDMARQRLGLS